MEGITQLQCIEDLKYLSENEAIVIITDLEIGESIQLQYEELLFEVFNNGSVYILETHKSGRLIEINKNTKVTFRSSLDINSWIFNHIEGIANPNEFEESIE